MPVTTESHENDPSTLRRRHHAECFVCGCSNGCGLGLDCRSTADGAVAASFDCVRVFQGYPEMLHGGVICSLLDGAMTNCLFAHGHTVVTADLHVRFRHPVATGRAAQIKAWVESSCRPLHVMKAELRQDGQLKATAQGKFLEKPRQPWGTAKKP